MKNAFTIVLSFLFDRNDHTEIQTLFFQGSPGPRVDPIIDVFSGKENLPSRCEARALSAAH